MSAASPAQPQVRRTAPAAPSRAPQAAAQEAPAQKQASTRVYEFSKPRGEDEIQCESGRRAGHAHDHGRRCVRAHAAEPAVRSVRPAPLSADALTCAAQTRRRLRRVLLFCLN